MACAQWLTEEIGKGRRCAWVASFFKRAATGFELITGGFKEAAKHGLVQIKWNPMQLRCPASGGALEVFSGDNPQALYGDAFDSMVIDEATRQGETIWTAARSTVTATGGRIRIAFNTDVSSKQWAVREFLRAKTGQEPSYGYITMPSYDSPYVLFEDVEQARRTLPDRVFRALYLAEVQDDGAGVFPNHQNSQKGSLEDGPGYGTYVIGMDVARKSDWTVLACFNTQRRHMVAFERMWGVPWSEQVQRAKAMALRFKNAHIVCDATGVGDVVVELMKREGLDVEPYIFTSPARNLIVEKLMAAFQHGKITYPLCQTTEVLAHELDYFEFKVTPGGNVAYGAPEGYHDDSVYAMALANYHLDVASVPLLSETASQRTWQRDLPQNILGAF